MNGQLKLYKLTEEQGKPKGRAVACVSPSAGTVIRFNNAPELQYEQYENCETHYRDSVCELCCRLVCVVMAVPLDSLRKKTRSTADIALARQVAMYLSHTTFSILLTEVGLHFKRDRTTVSHACQLIESKRDDPHFDNIINELEALLNEARDAMAYSYNLGLNNAFDALPIREG